MIPVQCCRASLSCPVLCWPTKWFSSHSFSPPHNTTGNSFCRVRRVKTLGQPPRVKSPLRRRVFSLTNLTPSTYPVRLAINSPTMAGRQRMGCRVSGFNGVQISFIKWDSSLFSRCLFRSTQHSPSVSDLLSCPRTIIPLIQSFSFLLEVESTQSLINITS